jgi:multiple sugar transport system ATP-binding protein
MMRIPSAKAKNLAPYENRTVILGIRPEHIAEHTGGETADETCVVTAKTEIAEMTGGEVNVYFDIDSHRCIARIRTDRKISSGETVKLLLDCNTAHFFDKDTSKAIGRI